MSRILYLSSSNTDYSLTLRNAIANGDILSLQSIKIPLTFNNVSALSATVTISSTSYTVTLTGRYNSVTELLMNLCSSLSTASGATFTYGLNSYTSKVTLTCSSSFSATVTSTLFVLLGIASNQTGSGTSLTFSNPHQFSSINTPLLLSIGSGSKDLIKLSGGTLSTNWILPLKEGDTGDSVELVDSNKDYSCTCTERTDNLNIRLCDISGNQLDLKYVPWSMIMHIN